MEHLIKEIGVEKTIKLYEERISYARTHPRNPFFIGVIHDSEEKLKKLSKHTGAMAKNSLKF